MMWNWRRSTLLAITAALFTACADAPTRPLMDASRTALGGLADRPFYLYQGQPIYLDIDPTRIVVSSPEPDAFALARELLAGIATVTDGGRPTQAPGHRILGLPAASTQVAERAVERLRADARFDFVAPAYRSTEYNSDVLLLNRLDVHFAAGTGSAQIHDVLTTFGLDVLRPPRPDSGFFAYRVRYPHGADPLRVAQAVYKSPVVIWADPDKITDVRPHYVPGDPYYPMQFYLKNTETFNGIPVDINIEPAWTLSYSNVVVVAIIDDGVDVSHCCNVGDLGWINAGGYDLLYDPSRPWEDAFHPCCNDTHGTAVAGIIVGEHNGRGIAGIAGSIAQKASVRIFRRTYPPELIQAGGSPDYAGHAATADGINWAWSAAGAGVISNSWGGGSPSDAITSAINYALTLGRDGLGTVVVFSAGNPSNRDAGIIGDVHYPATLSSTTNVISVSAINRYGGPANYAPNGPIDLVAPSGHYSGSCFGEVVTTDLLGSRGCSDGPGGDVDYSSNFSGTSASAPQVSAVAALMISRGPFATAGGIKTTLRNSADPWGPSVTFGAGKLNAGKALGVSGGGGPPTHSATINGQFSVEPFALCYWHVSTTVPNPTTYEWRVNHNVVGSNTFDLWYQNDGSPFNLQVAVSNDAGEHAADIKDVNVFSGAGDCSAS